ncbi:MAG: IS256 family transposase [Candidatus Neomarinimicrobiota bacterium]|jgi:putative transposase
MDTKKQHELLDDLLKDYKTPEEILGENGLLKQLTKSLVERALEGEMNEHLGYKRHRKTIPTTNSRNGTSKKTVKGDLGEFEITIPRDREGSFEPTLIEKHQTRFDGFDDKIIAMYARGMSTRDIATELKTLYGVDISASFISNVTDSIMPEVKAWQNRPLEPIYPVVYLDAIHIKNRNDGPVISKPVYLAIGINLDGIKEVLGMWIARTEGAKFWLSILTELKNRGIKDIFIASVDGLKGFPEAIESVYPETQIQLCIVHMVRNSLKFVSWKQRTEMAADLKAIYGSTTEEEGRRQLDFFAEKWDDTHPTVSKSWIANWPRLSTFFDYPDEIRKVIYTTNAIESLNYSLRKIVRTSGSFPNDDAVFKVIYLGLMNASKKWSLPIRNWKAALNHFAILFEERMRNFD